LLGSPASCRFQSNSSRTVSTLRRAGRRVKLESIPKKRLLRVQCDKIWSFVDSEGKQSQPAVGAARSGRGEARDYWYPREQPRPRRYASTAGPAAWDLPPAFGHLHRRLGGLPGRAAESVAWGSEREKWRGELHRAIRQHVVAARVEVRAREPRTLQAPVQPHWVALELHPLLQRISTCSAPPLVEPSLYVRTATEVRSPNAT